jgi:hypothetical protein
LHTPALSLEAKGRVSETAELSDAEVSVVVGDLEAIG